MTTETDLDYHAWYQAELGEIIDTAWNKNRIPGIPLSN